MVDASIAPAGASPMWVSDNRWPVDTPVASCKFAIAGSRSPTVMGLIGPASNIAPSASQTGREREPTPTRRKIARPGAPVAGEFIGRE
jgi:hypothetical protein